MATRPQPPNVGAAGADPRAAAGRDDRTEQALARSREIRKEGNRQIQAVREYVATVRRNGPGARPGPAGPDPATQLLDVGEEIERSRQARAHLAAMAARLVRTEEAVARINDEMARRDSGRAAQYRRAADNARQAARHAREIQRDAAKSDPR